MLKGDGAVSSRGGPGSPGKGGTIAANEGQKSLLNPGETVAGEAGAVVPGRGRIVKGVPIGSPQNVSSTKGTVESKKYVGLEKRRGTLRDQRRQGARKTDFGILPGGG